MRIFVSYEKRDEKWVKRLEDALDAVGVEKFTNDLKKYLGVRLMNLHELNRAMPGCSQALVVLSPYYVGSGWLISELAAFRMKEENTKTDFIIPIKIRECKIPDQLKSHKCIDFSTRNFEEAFKDLKPRIRKDRCIFVVMNYGDKMETTYNGVIRTIEEAQFKPIGKEALQQSKTIDDRILAEIASSEIVFADLTGHRASCCYEVGYAHALGKNVILTIKKGQKIPFDLASYPFIKWKDDDDLVKQLKSQLDSFKGSPEGVSIERSPA